MAMGLLIGAGLSAIAAVIVMRVLAVRSAEQRPPTPINLGSPARNEV
jgi:hypothetical protein